MILDRDSKFDADVITFLKATGLKPKRTSIQSPWQNGTAERWVGSCRREILDHVIALDERHLLRLMRDYVSYHHRDRVHDSLEKDTPDRRAIEPKPAASAIVTSMPRLGGLHATRGAKQHRSSEKEFLSNGNAQDAARRIGFRLRKRCDLPATAVSDRPKYFSNSPRSPSPRGRHRSHPQPVHR